MDVADRIKGRLGEESATVLGAAVDGRVHLVAAVTPALVARGVKAGAIVKAAATVAGGGGGGRDTMAQAGGRDPDKLPEAIAAARAAIEAALAEVWGSRAGLRRRALRLCAERSDRHARHADRAGPAPRHAQGICPCLRPRRRARGRQGRRWPAAVAVGPRLRPDAGDPRLGGAARGAADSPRRALRRALHDVAGQPRSRRSDLLGGLAGRRAPADRLAGRPRRRRAPALRSGGRVAFMTNPTAT